MKILNLLLVLALLSSHAFAQLSSKQRGLRQLVQQHLPHWSKTLVGAVVTSSLLLSSPVVAQDLQPAGHHTQATRAEHQSVFNLMLVFNETERPSHFVYVGQDWQRRALLLGLRLNVTIVPFAEAGLMLGVAEAWFFDHEGLVQRDAEVEEVQAFLRPDIELARLYDLTLLTVKGLATQDYRAVRVGAFPPPATPLDIVVYRTDLAGAEGAAEWVKVFSNAPLAREECMATSFAPELWSAIGNCTTGRLGVSVTAPIFTASDGELVAFGLTDTEMVVIPPEVQAYVEEALAVEAEQKLPTAWGAIKRGEY